MSDTLSETIADTIRTAIRHGTYVCGDRLVELTLSQDLKVSQNTIRDALHHLEQEGWVQKIPRRGVYIPEFTLKEAKEVYALWHTIEALALEWAIDALSDTERSRLRETMISAEESLHNQRWTHVRSAIYTFHTVLVLYAEAPRIHAILHRLHNQARLLENQRTRIAYLSDDEWETRLEFYFDLLLHIDQHNLDRAKHFQKRIIDYTAELVLPFIE